MSAERRRIERILELVKRFRPGVESPLPPSVGLDGLDDCAVIPLPGGLDLVAGSDFVRGEGFSLFRCGVLSRSDIGYYLVGANLSDIAAMGATPIGILVAFRYTKDTTDDEFAEVMGGVVDACRDFATPLLGGDTGGYDASVLSAAALGVCAHGRAMLRSGGRADDFLYLTGDVGTAGAALAYFTRAKPEGHSLDASDEFTLASAWRRLRPALAQGRILTDGAYSRCAIDTSDGLKAAARQLAQASGLHAVVDEARLPIAPVVYRVAALLGVDPVALAVGDSVDFRLLFSCPPSAAEAMEAAFQAAGHAYHRIGVLCDAQGPVVGLRDEHGLREMPGVEWAQSSTASIDLLRQGSLPR